MEKWNMLTELTFVDWVRILFKFIPAFFVAQLLWAMMIGGAVLTVASLLGISLGSDDYRGDVCTVWGMEIRGGRSCTHLHLNRYMYTSYLRWRTYTGWSAYLSILWRLI